MPWTMTPNVAQYQGANWENYVKTVPNCPPNEAKRIAFQDPQISYFFYCRGAVALTNGRAFNPGDAVFFSGTQKPWWGGAPQCDGYKRMCLSVAYSSASEAQQTLDLEFHGEPAADVIIVAANLNDKSTHVPHHQRFIRPDAPGPTMWRAWDEVIQFLESPFIAAAQAKGVAVVLDGLNNWDSAGWSRFQTSADAEQFAQQTQAIVNTFGLDGIDIDDEYSVGTVNCESLAMASYFVSRAIDSKPLSKALFNDLQFSTQEFNDTTIFSNLTWGWTMAYGATPQEQLEPYANLMRNNQLCCGFWVQRPNPTAADIRWLAEKGYAGIMTFKPTEGEGKQMLKQLLTFWSHAEV